MLSEKTIAVADEYWRDHLRCSAPDFFGEDLRVIAHSPDLADYHGLFAFFRRKTLIVSAPQQRCAPIAAFLSQHSGDVITSPGEFARACGSLHGTVIGPAFIGYADHGTIESPVAPLRVLTTDDDAAIRELREACSASDWETGGCGPHVSIAAGFFVAGRLVTIAGYEGWGRTIAHISVVTHPEFRGRGFARRVVCQLAYHALSAGLLPQYRTLVANAPSMQIARALGFQHYATSVAVRLHRDANEIM